ncbi:DUF2959 domain-containing protein [Desulfovibrio inopinatus]|uniref:DUF2959 domain-containing protein n=1 Tax=Desulfovibrio inopinatus TaxID=102109 RepID=UPI0004062001|nr:DUF2959 domain-containing protein [Desulfovibrio inopinatus]
MTSPLIRIAGLLLLTLCFGCNSAYYTAMETLGIPKRELLSDNITKVRTAQTEAGQEFQSALEAFLSLTGYQGGDLEAMYERMSDAYEDSESKATEVRQRIRAVDNVAQALFDEWEDELNEYENSSLRRQSETKLKQTRRRYDELLRSMERVENAMVPVLAAFKDQVLFLKHNLNARAVSALSTEASNIEANVADLIKDMNASIAEADRFLGELNAKEQ